MILDIVGYVVSPFALSVGICHFLFQSPMEGYDVVFLALLITVFNVMILSHNKWLLTGCLIVAEVCLIAYLFTLDPLRSERDQLALRLNINASTVERAITHLTRAARSSIESSEELFDLLDQAAKYREDKMKRLRNNKLFK